MSVQFSDIKDALYDWANGATNQTVRWANQDATAPAKPYVILRIMSARQLGDMHPINAVEDGEIVPNERVEVTQYQGVLSVQCFGPGAYETALSLQNTLNNAASMETLASAGVVLYNDGSPVNDLTGLDEHNNEERAQFDAPMRFSDIIEGVEFETIELVEGEVIGQPTTDEGDDIVNDLTVEAEEA
jgi:hypothetical protein